MGLNLPIAFGDALELEGDPRFARIMPIVDIDASATEEADPLDERMPELEPSGQCSNADHVWSIGELLDVALAVAPAAPTETAPDRRRRFRVIIGGLQ